MRRFFAAVFVSVFAAPVTGQWLNLPTPGIPRDANGRAILNPAKPRTADGKPDLTGPWRTVAGYFRPDPSDVQPWARDVARQRADSFFKTRPSYQCLPSGAEGFPALKRILQNPTVIAILNEDLVELCWDAAY